jgi:hypothetical protein
MAKDPGPSIWHGGEGGGGIMVYCCKISKFCFIGNCQEPGETIPQAVFAIKVRFQSNIQKVLPPSLRLSVQCCTMNKNKFDQERKFIAKGGRVRGENLYRK